METKIIELDNNHQMTVEQTFARAQREGLTTVIIIGLNPRGNLALITSDLDDYETYWALKKAAQAVFDES